MVSIVVSKTSDERSNRSGPVKTYSHGYMASYSNRLQRTVCNTVRKGVGPNPTDVFAA